MGHTTSVRTLAADDQVDILDALRMLLGDEGDEVATARPFVNVRWLSATNADPPAEISGGRFRRLQQYGVTE